VEEAWLDELSTQKRRDPPKRVPFALVLRLPGLLPALFRRDRVFEQLLVLRRETLRKAENLKAVAIADGPELDFG